MESCPIRELFKQLVGASAERAMTPSERKFMDFCKAEGLDSGDDDLVPVDNDKEVEVEVELNVGVENNRGMHTTEEGFAERVEELLKNLKL